MPSKEFCGDCHGEWACHDCPYHDRDLLSRFAPLESSPKKKKCNSKSKVQSSKPKRTERDVRMELIAPILIGYLESLHNLAKAEKGKYEILNGKSLAEDIKRYIKILKSDWT